MLKRTLYFGNPTYLSLKLGQVVIKLPEVENNDSLPDDLKKNLHKTVPIEDIGVIVLDHKQITITQALIEQLLKNNCAIITCDENHLPLGLMLPLSGNTTQTERFQAQISASLPLKKQLWQQTVQAKILNQASHLSQAHNVVVRNMNVWASEVKSGDTNNYEARAAVYYWANLFPNIPDFTRDRFGVPPNNLLNYGYAILRAIVARSLVVSGLIPTLGIFHKNKYNAYCLADDIMEPYRPFVDKLVMDIMKQGGDINEVTTELKVKFLSLPTLEVKMSGQRCLLMNAVGQTTASLAKCYLGESRKIVYPEF